MAHSSALLFLTEHQRNGPNQLQLQAELHPSTARQAAASQLPRCGWPIGKVVLLSAMPRHVRSNSYSDRDSIQVVQQQLMLCVLPLNDCHMCRGLCRACDALQTAFVPSGAGQLHTPGELYDPRVPELVALLDPDACFPAPAFCSADLADPEAEEQQGAAAASAVTDSSGSGSFSSLAALQQLGLRSTADLGTLVLAARYVDETAKQGDEDLAVARGKVSIRASAVLLQLVPPSLHGGCVHCLGFVEGFRSAAKVAGSTNWAEWCWWQLGKGNEVVVGVVTKGTVCLVLNEPCPCLLHVCRRCFPTWTQKQSGWWGVTQPLPALQLLPLRQQRHSTSTTAAAGQAAALTWR